MTTLEMSREDVLDLIGILVTSECAMRAYFKEHEPLVSRAADLGHDIVKQLAEQECLYDVDLSAACSKFNVRGLNI